MTILIDTREQLPLEFKHRYITDVKQETLSVGDYAVRFNDGHTPPFRFERKGVGDLFGTLGQGYKRFKREIIRSQELKLQMFLIIEGSLSQILCGYEHSTIEGISIVKKLYTLWIRHNVQPIFCKSRSEMSEYITQFYLAVGREYVKQKKQG